MNKAKRFYINIVLILIAVVLVCANPANVSALSTDNKTYGDDGEMRWEMKKEISAFDIFGYVDGQMKQTTYRKLGYIAWLRVGNQEQRFDSISAGTENTFSNNPDIKFSVKPEIIDIGGFSFVKVDYIVKNTSSSAKVISVAAAADIQIGADDYAPLDMILGENYARNGLFMKERISSSGQYSPGAFIFICGNNSRVTDVDTLWIGRYPTHINNQWNGNSPTSVSGMDSTMTYSWQNRELGGNSTLTFSVLFGVTPAEESPMYSVEFDLNGAPGTPPARQILSSGSTAFEPSPVPVWDAHSFDGWYKDSDCTEKYDFSMPVTQNITLYAKWIIDNIYTVTFDLGDISGTPPPPQRVSEGRCATNPGDMSSYHSGCKFEGWYRYINDSSILFDFDDPVTEDILLYAKWENPHVVVSFDLNGFMGGLAPPPQTLENGERVQKPHDPIRNQHIFIGWFTERECTNLYDFEEAIIATHEHNEDDITLYAGWTKEGGHIDIDYSVPEILVFGFIDDEESKTHYINLSVETIVLQDYESVAYSPNGGKRWYSKPITEAVLGKLFNSKDVVLWVTDKYDKKAKSPTQDAVVIKFPTIKRRPKTPKLYVNYSILSDPTGTTPGQWVLTQRKGTVMVKDGIQIALASSAVRMLTQTNTILIGADGKGYGIFFSEEDKGIRVDPYQTDIKKVLKSIFLIRIGPSGDAETGYTAGSKPKKIHAFTQSAPPKIKVNEKKNIIKLKAGMYVFKGNVLTGNSNILSITKQNAKPGLDIEGYRGKIYIWKAATDKKPSSAIQIIERW